MLAVVSDKKEFVSEWKAVVLSAQDYYPFGMSMPNRKYTGGGSYRYGFNGKETDSETGIQDYGMRWYLPNIARFPSVDPLAKSYPWYTPYQFAGNTPILAVDLDGLEILNYNSLNNDSGYKRVVSILTATKLWDNLLDNTFAVNRGVYANANIEIQFGVDNKLFGVAQGLASIHVMRGEKDIPLLDAIDFQKGDKIQMRISVAPTSFIDADVNDTDVRNANNCNVLFGIMTLIHEFTVHVMPNADKAKDFTEGKIDFQTFQDWYRTQVNNQKMESSEENKYGMCAYKRTYVKGHKQIRDKSNQNYESLMDAVEALLGQMKTTVKGVKDTHDPYDSNAKVTPSSFPVGTIPYPNQAKSNVGIFETTLKSLFRDIRNSEQERYTGKEEPKSH